MDPYVIEGARVILPLGEEDVSVRVEGGKITGLDSPRDGARVIDGRGKILAPAIVDIHGDAFERQLMPRPGVDFPLHAALLETDRQLAANGIATAYHALTLSWEPGLRSVAMGNAVLDGLLALAPRLVAWPWPQVLLFPATASRQLQAAPLSSMPVHLFWAAAAPSTCAQVIPWAMRLAAMSLLPQAQAPPTRRGAFSFKRQQRCAATVV